MVTMALSAVAASVQGVGGVPHHLVLLIIIIGFVYESVPSPASL